MLWKREFGSDLSDKSLFFQEILEGLRWMMQKDSISQDMMLVGRGNLIPIQT
jgi:hypothetical protein